MSTLESTTVHVSLLMQYKSRADIESSFRLCRHASQPLFCILAMLTRLHTRLDRRRYHVRITKFFVSETDYPSPIMLAPNLKVSLELVYGLSYCSKRSPHISVPGKLCVNVIIATRSNRMELFVIAHRNARSHIFLQILWRQRLLRNFQRDGSLAHISDGFDGWTFPLRESLLQLCRLSLHRLALSTRTTTLLDEPRVSYLRGLLLQKCRNTAPLLQAFAAVYTLSNDNQTQLFQPTNGHAQIRRPDIRLKLF